MSDDDVTLADLLVEYKLLLRKVEFLFAVKGYCWNCHGRLYTVKMTKDCHCFSGQVHGGGDQ